VEKALSSGSYPIKADVVNRRGIAAMFSVEKKTGLRYVSRQI
jgi:hypothetical protein